MMLLAAVVGCGRSNPTGGDSFAGRYDRAMAEVNAERRGALLIRLAVAQYSAKDEDGMERSLGAAATTAADVDDAVGRTSLFRRVASLQAQTGNRSAAANAVREAHKAAQKIDEPEQRASALCGIADVEGVGLKRPAAARKSLEQALALVAEMPDIRGQVTVLASAGSTYARIGDATKAGELIAQATTLVAEIIDPAGQTGALVRIARAQLRMEDTPAAIESLHRARATAEKIGREHNKALKMADVAEQLARAGEAAEARQLVAAADKVVDQIKDTALRRQATQRVARAKAFVRKASQ